MEKAKYDFLLISISLLIKKAYLIPYHSVLRLYQVPSHMLHCLKFE